MTVLASDQQFKMVAHHFLSREAELDSGTPGIEETNLSMTETQESKEMRGLRNIVRSDLEAMDRGESVPPVMNSDGSIIDAAEAKELGETIKAARKAVGLDA